MNKVQKYIETNQRQTKILTKQIEKWLQNNTNTNSYPKIATITKEIKPNGDPSPFDHQLIKYIATNKLNAELHNPDTHDALRIQNPYINK
jgi:hypothetical protein